MTPQERQEFNIMKQKIESLENSATVSYEVESALRERFNINSFTPLTGSVKLATSENQAVNEGGTQSYSVLKTPDGFLQTTINGIVYYIPYYS